MPVNEPFKKKWTRFCETILREGGFAKPRLMFFKFGEDFEFCPRGGRVWEGIRAGFYFFKFGEIRNSATQMQIQSVPSFIISYCVQTKGNSTLGASAFGHFRYGYECLGAYGRALARASWGEEVSSPRVGTTLSDYRECSALAIPTLRFSILFSWCRFRSEVQYCNSGQALVL